MVKSKRCDAKERDLTQYVAMPPGLWAGTDRVMRVIPDKVANCQIVREIQMSVRGSLQAGARSRTLIECRAAYGCVAGMPLSSVESVVANAPVCWTKSTSVMPRYDFNLSAATFFIGPGESALPGAGCGKAVDRAV
jgi:hypothetical protein